MLKKWMLALCAGGFALGACAADDGATATSPEGVVRQALFGLAPKAQIDSIKPSPLPGFYQVIASGQLVFVSNDGKYMVNGNVVDLSSKKDVSDAAWADFRKAELAKLPVAQRIVFAPANPKHTVIVFTDVNCGYCRSLHEHIGDFNKAGIAVEYIAWPREGVTSTSGKETPTYTEMSSVWCAADRNAAFSAAIKGAQPKPESCANPVKDQFNLGLKLGITGTPTIIAADGSIVGGYVTADQLLKALDKRKSG
ncbi:thioredoxin fold domain-containing protein [Dyella tabacisoli]|uniref:Thiol:disulfide interchange protein n=1 Tax=Dyella tabacisoli TaxID=2282381 RepID=A0A369UX35_9GAMM|nr:thioredoxin fold domain-containing protein [Dyella tabacisoli]RDD82889.1 DsbC family protein [Dyella tabacisoli]